MSDQSYSGRLKHAAALIALAITEEERGEELESMRHLDMVTDAIRQAWAAAARGIKL
jgi:hypothetical protein